MMGMAGLAAFLPATLLSPLAGIAADRYNRKYICVCADMFVGAVAAVFCSAAVGQADACVDCRSHPFSQEHEQRISFSIFSGNDTSIVCRLKT